MPLNPNDAGNSTGHIPIANYLFSRFIPRYLLHQSSSTQSTRTSTSSELLIVSDILMCIRTTVNCSQVVHLFDLRATWTSSTVSCMIVGLKSFVAITTLLQVFARINMRKYLIRSLVQTMWMNENSSRKRLFNKLRLWSVSMEFSDDSYATLFTLQQAHLRLNVHSILGLVFNLLQKTKCIFAKTKRLARKTLIRHWLQDKC